MYFDSFLTIYTPTEVYVCSPCEKETGRRTVSKYQLSLTRVLIFPLFFLVILLCLHPLVAYTYYARFSSSFGRCFSVCSYIDDYLSFRVLYNIDCPLRHASPASYSLSILLDAHSPWYAYSFESSHNHLHPMCAIVRRCPIYPWEAVRVLRQSVSVS